MRTIKGSYSKPINVCLRGGIYELKRTFELRPADSGTATAPITYRAYPDERVVVSGGKRLRLSWAPYKGSIFVATTREAFNSLFVNGQRAIRARTPNGNATFNMDCSVLKTACYCPSSPPPACNGSQFIFFPGNIDKTWSNPTNIEIVSMERFISPRQTVKAIDGNIVTVNGTINQGYGYDYAGTDRYYIENLLEALDSPGEWYLDTSAHKLYYWPRRADEITSGEFVAPILYQLVSGGSYPENTASLLQAATNFGSDGGCRHIGVYPTVADTLSFAATSFSVTSWVRFPSVPENPQWVFTKGNPLGNAPTGAGGNGYGVRTESITDTVPVQFFVHDGTHRIIADVGAQPRDKWIHLAFVVDRGAKQIRAYVNGVLDGTTTKTSLLGSIGSTLPLDIGAYTNTACSTSTIADFRIYSQALTGAQVAEISAGAAVSDGLALRLAFNGDYQDSSATANRSVVFYAPAFTTGLNGGKAADFSTAASWNDLSGSVDYVGFSNLEFEYTDWTLPFTGYPGTQEAYEWTSPSAIYLHARHARVADSRFRHIGSHALSGMLSCSSITNNSFTDIGGAAIKIGQGLGLYEDKTKDPAPLSVFASCNMITGNRIKHTGIVVHDSAALTIFQGENNTISRNVVADAPYSGLSVGWFTTEDFAHGGHNKISLNRVSGVMRILNDGSGLYILGNQPGTVVERNVFHDIVKTPAQLNYADHLDRIWGIYLDNDSKNMMVRDNLSYRTQDGGIMLNSPPMGWTNTVSNTVTNNIFVDGLTYQLYFNSAIQGSFKQNIVYYSGNPSSTVFPIRTPDAIGKSDYNLFYSPSGMMDLKRQLEIWKALKQPVGSPLFDQHSIMSDPQFAEYADHDFRLLPSSPALLSPSKGGIGFKPINFAGLPPP